MSKQGTVAPKERVNIVYKSDTGDGVEEVELPLKMLMVGDYTGRSDETPLEDRKPINIDKDNFDDVLGSHKLELSLAVPDKLSGEEGAEIPVKLKFDKMSDFGPEAIVNQVDELRMLLELRSALTALKGPLGNVPAFRRKLQTMLGDDASRAKLMGELGINDAPSGDAPSDDAPSEG